MTRHTSLSDSATSTAARERNEKFTVDGSIAAHIATRSGDVTVSAGDAATVTVRLRVSPGAPASLLDDSEIRYDESTRTLDVVSAAVSQYGRHGSAFGLGLRRSLFGGLHDVDVEVTIPASSAIEVKTGSGDCQLTGQFAEVSASCASGDVAIDDATAVEVRSASGDVRVNRARQDLTVRTASGDISVGQGASTSKLESASGDVVVLSTGHSTDAATASGDIAVTATTPGRLRARTASGDVRVTVRAGLDIDVDANSVSGDLTSSIPLDSAPSRSTSTSEALSVSVATVSGDVKVVRETT
jgi:Toastrack DUF4097